LVITNIQHIQNWPIKPAKIPIWDELLSG